jgi:hypothetical protein
MAVDGRPHAVTVVELVVFGQVHLQAYTVNSRLVKIFLTISFDNPQYLRLEAAQRGEKFKN